MELDGSTVQVSKVDYDLWRLSNSPIVASTQVSDVLVETYMRGVDNDENRPEDEAPDLFRTHTVGVDLPDCPEQPRYKTFADALAGHAAFCVSLSEIL